MAFGTGSACVHCLDIPRNTREQLIQKQLLMQSVSQAQQNVLLKEQVRETKRRHLKSQMNPHFIFNVLTGIQNLLQNGESEKAGTVFSRFRRLLMLGFMSQDRVLGPLAQEMDHVNQYLELERTRLSESIQFQWNIASDVLPAVIPCPLFILQPLVENAIWHGLSGTGVDQPTLTIQFTGKNKISSSLCAITARESVPNPIQKAATNRAEQPSSKNG